jgi:CheY-like chemotaxis protein
MHEPHDGVAALNAVSQPQTEAAPLPWRSSPRLAVEQLSFATTDGALALAEESPTQAAEPVVLIAESDPALAAALQEELRQLAGWRTLLARDAQHATDLIADTRPRLILLDIELTGVNLYAQTRGRPASYTPHVIFVTTATSYNLHQLGVREGLLLRKPYHPHDLAGIVRALLDA